MKSLEIASLPRGTYVIAVSGGVDSMVLLELLAQQTSLELIVAHFNHGIRADSDEDEELVRKAAAKYSLAYIYDKVHLGAGVSEDVARRARYDFLRRAAKEHDAKIITAHHEDDVLETAVLNLLRGTGRRGLSSLTSNDEIVRPLLNAPKKEIIAYARAHDIAWREDNTNANENYARNYVRQKIMPRLGVEGRAALLKIIANAKELNDGIEESLRGFLAVQSNDELERRWFTMLPHDVSCEVMAAFLRAHGIRDFTARDVRRLVVAAKVLVPGKRADVLRGRQLIMTKTSIKFG